MTELIIKPYINKNMRIYRLDVKASNTMESKREFFQKRKELLKTLNDNNMNYNITFNHSWSMKLHFFGNETQTTFKLMFL